ncbi:MAG: signal peptidase I [Terriglobia bacterium]
MTDHYKKSSTRDTFESLVVTVILAIFGTTFVVQAFKIPTGSMEDTLLIGDHLLVNKFAFADQPGLWRHFLPYKAIHRGDVLVFKYPANYPSVEEQQEPGEDFVKRVIGVPGDQIRVVNRKVFVNGVQLKDSYVLDSYPHEVLPADNFPPPPNASLPGWIEDIRHYLHNGELVVPPGHYFVMGDNRENSWDSRFWGFVPIRLVSGSPLVIYWSFETPPDEYLRTSLSDRVDQMGDLLFHFFTKTRWRRTFRLVR